MTIRKNWMKTKRNPTLTSTFLRILESIRSLKWALLGLILPLLFLGHCFGYDIWQAPPGQPEQMSSRVEYDPKLRNKFFDSNEWSCPGGLERPVTCRGGKPVLILNDPCDSWLTLFLPERCFELKEWSCPDGCKECATCQDGDPVLKNTARCYAISYGIKHPVNFCRAKLLDGQVIDLLFHKETPAFRDYLLVRISAGKFSCQYWTAEGFDAFTWATTRQTLILDKEAYGKGDVIKGRIDFECLGEQIRPIPPIPAIKIRIIGVFKTIVE